MKIQLKDIVIPQGLLPRVITGTVEAKVKEYAEMMEEGVKFDPIMVWDRGGEYWIVDGVHRYTAHKLLGRETIDVIFVHCKDELDYRRRAIIENLKHGLPLLKEEKILLAQTLYQQGVKEEEIQKLFGISRATFYRWISSIKQENKGNLKQKAKQLYYDEGKSLRQVAEELGVSPPTILNWLDEEVLKNSQDEKNLTPHEEEETKTNTLPIREDGLIDPDEMVKVVMANYEDEEEQEQEKQGERKRNQPNVGRPVEKCFDKLEELETLANEMHAIAWKIAAKFGRDKAIDITNQILYQLEKNKFEDIKVSL